MSGVIPIVISTLSAHCPASGVKVYVVVVLGSKAGLQVPVTPLVSDVGSGFGSPIHIGEIGLKTLGSFGVTVISTLSVVASPHSSSIVTV